MFNHFFYKIGWGDIENDGDPIFLQNVELNMISGLHCYKHQWPDLPVPKDLGTGYCLNGTNGNETLCIGDSGGPAFWEDQNDSGRAYLIGIAAETYFPLTDQKCGEEPINPGVFARVNVANTLNWLIPNAGKELEDCLLDDCLLDDCFPGGGTFNDMPFE